MIHQLRLTDVPNQLEQWKRSVLEPAVTALNRGELIIFPTETSYMLGGNALSALTMERLRQMKGRSQTHDMSVMVASISMAQRYTSWSEEAVEMGTRYLPGPLTFIVPIRQNVTQFAASGNSLGIRIPDNQPLQALLAAIDYPITATSANPHGGAEPYCVSQCVDSADFIWDAGVLTPNKPSTIISFMGSQPVILRKGAILPSEIT